MSPQNLLLCVTTLVLGCTKWSQPYSAPTGDDTSIVFPPFFAQEAVTVGSSSAPLELDGELLRALMIAANDFSPPGAPEQDCLNRQESNSYRVLRQGPIIFVHVRKNPEHCGLSWRLFDSGAKYAISAQGHILRRIVDGQPTQLWGPGQEDGGSIGEWAEPGTLPEPDASTPSSPLPAPHPMWDGGTPADSSEHPPPVLPNQHPPAASPTPPSP